MFTGVKDKNSLKTSPFGFQCIPENYRTEISQMFPESHEVVIVMGEDMLRQRRQMDRTQTLTKPPEITVSAACIQVFWDMEKW